MREHRTTSGLKGLFSKFGPIGVGSHLRAATGFGQHYHTSAMIGVGMSAATTAASGAGSA